MGEKGRREGEGGQLHPPFHCLPLSPPLLSLPYSLLPTLACSLSPPSPSVPSTSHLLMFHHALSSYPSIQLPLPLSGPEVAPANFIATRHTRRSGSIVLQWTAIPLQHRNGLLTGYVVTTVPSNGRDQPQELILEPNLASFELTGLTPDTQYNISISAFTEAGRGPTAEAQVMLNPRGIHRTKMVTACYNA